MTITGEALSSDSRTLPVAVTTETAGVVPATPDAAWDVIILGNSRPVDPPMDSPREMISVDDDTQCRYLWVDSRALVGQYKWSPSTYQGMAELAADNVSASEGLNASILAVCAGMRSGLQRFYGKAPKFDGLTARDIAVTLSGPIESFGVQLLDAKSSRQHVIRKCSDRIANLRDLAAEEGVAFNERSADDLLAFLKRYSRPQEPKIFLLDNGNLRAVWRRSDLGISSAQIGLEFVGKRSVKMVMIADSAQTFGLSDFDSVATHAAALGIGILFGQ
jgi:hypothetical protein